MVELITENNIEFEKENQDSFSCQKHSRSETKESSNCVDFVKLICTILIVASHCLPLFLNQVFDFYYGQWFFRFCVPFFFISSGFFYLKMDSKKRKKYLLRILIIYVVSSLIYLPAYIRQNPLGIIKDIIFGFSHLWYLSALLIGLLLVSLLEQCLKKSRFYFILLLFFGVFFDEYFKLLDISFLNNVAKTLEYIGGARHALLFALPMLLIGELICEKKNCSLFTNRILQPILFILFFASGLIECAFLGNKLDYSITLDCSFFGWLPAVPLFLICVNYRSFIVKKYSRLIRKTSDVVYLIHMGIIMILNKMSINPRLLLFLVAVIASYLFSLLFVILANRIITSIKSNKTISQNDKK